MIALENAPGEYIPDKQEACSATGATALEGHRADPQLESSVASRCDVRKNRSNSSTARVSSNNK